MAKEVSTRPTRKTTPSATVAQRHPRHMLTLPARSRAVRMDPESKYNRGSARKLAQARISRKKNTASEIRSIAMPSCARSRVMRSPKSNVHPIRRFGMLAVPQRPAAAHLGNLREILRQRRRRGGPFERPGVPGIVTGFGSEEEAHGNVRAD